MPLFDVSKQVKSNDWNWTFSDYPKHLNGLKVFSCFSCAGGSTMGYKLAGCDVLGNIEIDPKINEVYKINHNPSYNYCMDIREFNEIPNNKLPEELFNLDILDGSPPCTTFSMAGLREKSWGKKKRFAEGQVEQTLDDLLFVFIDTVKKLKPQVVIMENVTGLAYGLAQDYLKRVYNKFNSIGYSVRCYLLKAEKMGVPQSRHRLFFIATQNKLFDFNRLDLNFNYAPVYYAEIKDNKGKAPDIEYIRLLKQATYSDRCIADVKVRLGMKYAGFTNRFVFDNAVMPTILSSHKDLFDFENKSYVSEHDILCASTFPQDFNFMGKSVSYICGMCVPPIMIKRIVERLLEFNIFENKEIKNNEN